MTSNFEKLSLEIARVHTTEMGIERIRRNLKLDKNIDVLELCKKFILDTNSTISSKGKNWYINCDNCIITLNKTSYTIITAHQNQRKA